jgi:hypothetical protein
MSRLVALMILMIGCAGNSYYKKWSALDLSLEAGFAITQTIDDVQTHSITKQCAETDPIIGVCGKGVGVDVFFVSSVVLHVAVAAVLPPKWRTVWQGVTLGLQVDNVYDNAFLMGWKF